jgi:hypothetical protein
VKQLEGAGLDRAAGREDKGTEGNGDPAGVLEGLAPSGQGEGVVDGVPGPEGEREREVRVSTGRGRPSVLRGERDDGDVDLADTVGTGDAKVGSKLSARDKRLENNTKLDVRGEGVVDEPLDLLVATKSDRSTTRAGLVVTERSCVATVGAEVERAGAERPEVKTRSNLGVRQLEHRPEGDDTEPTSTEDRAGLGDGIALETREPTEDALEPSVEGLVAPGPLGDNGLVVVDLEQKGWSERPVGRLRAGCEGKRSTLGMREDP